jgi:hypothetical protein
MYLTAAHWIYALFVVIVIITMAKRRDALIPCIVGTFVVGWAVTGTPLGAIGTVFKSAVVAARELLDIILVISIIGGLAASLESIGAEKLMVAPARFLMKSPGIAFWVLGGVMLIASYFLWPSPATALVGAVLVPAAIAVRLPAISAAVAMNIFGHGIALSTDYVIQGAPSISAKAANVPVEALMKSQIPLIITMSIVTLAVAFVIARRDIKREAVREEGSAGTGSESIESAQITNTTNNNSRAANEVTVRPSATAWVAAITVPLSYLLVVVALVAFGIRGGDATTMIGGVTLLLIVVFTLLGHGVESFELVPNFLIKGFTFGIKIFAPVIIIASFFYLGSPDIARQVFGEGARGLLFDLAQALSNVLPLHRISVGIMETVTGVIVGLDGSGFAGLPLTGSLAGAFASAANLRTETIAALGQIAAVWVGGGCIIPWAVIPVAAICRVSPQELAIKNLVPVILGLVATTIVAIILM